MAILNFQRIIDNVLSVGNKEQNAHYPTYIAATHLNIATSFLLSEIARIYPNDKNIIELAKPFYKTKVLDVKNGYVELPADYRHLISLSIATNQDASNSCDCTDIESNNSDSVLYSPNKIAKSNCKFIEVKMLEDDRFNQRTVDGFVLPSLSKPIGKFADGNTIKICPTDVTHVEVRYLKQPKQYAIGYKLMPDDTYQIDNTSTEHIESEWELTAENKIMLCMTSLYSIYVQDTELKNANNELKKIGIF